MTNMQKHKRSGKGSFFRALYVHAITFGDLWIVTEMIRSQIQTPEMSFLWRLAGLCHLGGARKRAATQHLQEPVEVVWAGCFFLAVVFWACPWGRPTCMTSWIEHLGVLLEEVEEVVGKRVVLESLLLLLLHDPDPDIRHRMDEWMDQNYWRRRRKKPYYLQKKKIASTEVQQWIFSSVFWCCAVWCIATWFAHCWHIKLKMNHILHLSTKSRYRHVFIH